MEFIPIAEQTGLILQLTPWVAASALRQLRSWQASTRGLRLSINVAMRNLQDPAFLDEIEILLASWGIGPEGFVLEITEGTIMLEPQRTIGTLRGVRDLGLGVAVDDFGTGYSSLSYLSRLPVDEVKIDRSFVMAIEVPENRAIVAAVIDLGRALGLRVVAEGVKDESTWNVLAELGCPIAQGFHLSPPMPASEFEEWRRHHVATDGRSSQT